MSDSYKTSRFPRKKKHGVLHHQIAAPLLWRGLHWWYHQRCKNTFSDAFLGRSPFFGISKDLNFKPLKFNMEPDLVGGFNPSEKYWSKWESSPSRGENKIYLKPPPSDVLSPWSPRRWTSPNLEEPPLFSWKPAIKLWGKKRRNTCFPRCSHISPLRNWTPGPGRD